MILSSHNTMTYLDPKKKWMKIFKPIYQCQDKDIDKQYRFGVRYFDMRIAFDKKGNAEFRHGLIAFKDADPYKTIKWMNNYEGVIMRIVLERAKSKRDFTLFKMFCRAIQEECPNITFCCGEYKKTKEVIYDFGQNIPVIEMYGSVRGKGLKRIFPKLYAKRCNIELEWEYEKSNYLMLDFI